MIKVSELSKNYKLIVSNGYHLTLSWGRFSSQAMLKITFSMIKTACGTPNPLKAVLEGIFVLQGIPCTFEFSKL